MADRVTGFEDADTIDLAGIDADATHNGNQAFKLVGAFSGSAGEILDVRLAVLHVAIVAGEKRPSTSYTNKLKKQQLADWPGYSNKKLSGYEEDHLISLELGGSDSDPKNLWPEFWDKGKSPYKGTWGAHVKDRLEGELGRRICLQATDADYVSLSDARQAIADDWVKAFKKYVCTRKPALSPVMAAHCP